jgi:hypothetical protein
MTSPPTDGDKLRWVRAILAGIGAEVLTILVIVLAVSIYRAGGHTADDVERFGGQAGLVIGPAGGALFTFVMALWALRGVSGRYLAHGLLVAVGAIALHLVGVSAAPGGFRPIYLGADAAKLAAGLIAGLIAARR